jgi:hypothetical protein
VKKESDKSKALGDKPKTIAEIADDFALLVPKGRGRKGKWKQTLRRSLRR